jgi:hypothetical protein
MKWLDKFLAWAWPPPEPPDPTTQIPPDEWERLAWINDPGRTYDQMRERWESEATNAARENAASPWLNGAIGKAFFARMDALNPKRASKNVEWDTLSD